VLHVLCGLLENEVNVLSVKGKGRARGARRNAAPKRCLA